MRIPLGRTDYSRSVAQIPDIALINRFFEANPDNQKDQVALLCRPGLKKWLTMGHSPIRAVYSQPGTFGEAIFVAAGDTIYKIAQDETVTAIGTLDSSTGFVSMAATDVYLFIADGLALHYYTENDYAHGTLTSSGAISSGDKVQIGTMWYQFTSGDVETGTPDGTSAQPWLVALSGSVEQALTNLDSAMTGLGVAGQDYSSAILTNPDASPLISNATTLKIVAQAQGTAGNAIATTETGANLAWGAATLAGGGGTSFAAVAVPDDDGIVSVGVIASSVICVVAQGQGKNGRFYWIEPRATIIDPLNFATAERSPDPVWQVVVWGDQFWLPGSSTTEVWYPTGDALAPFQRQQGRLFDKGIWEGTIVQVKDSMMVVGTDGTVYKVTDVPEVVSNAGIAQRLREAINAQRIASGTIPYDTTPRVSIDFKNGVYSIAGVSKTLSQVVEHNVAVGAYSSADVVGGTGLQAATTTTATLPALTTAAFTAAAAGDAFSVVLTVVLTGTSTQRAQALVSYAPADESTAWEGYAKNFDSDNSGSVYDYGSETQDQDALPTLSKIGFTMQASGLKMCIDGGSVSTTGAPQANTAAMIYLEADIGGSAATAVIQKAEFFAPAGDGDLQALTA